MMTHDKLLIRQRIGTLFSALAIAAVSNILLLHAHAEDRFETTDLKELLRPELKENALVAFSGTIAHLYPYFKSSIVTDGEDFALLVFQSRAVHSEFKVGDPVRFDGNLSKLDGRITFKALNVTKLSSPLAKIPDPIDASIFLKSQNKPIPAFKRVTVQGVLTNIIDHGGRMSLRLEANGNEIHLRCKGKILRSKFLSRIGSTVEVTGFAYAAYKHDPTPGVHHIAFNNLRELKLIQEQNLAPHQMTGRVVCSSRNDRFFIKTTDKDKIIEINIPLHNDFIKPGDSIKLWGKASAAASPENFVAAAVRRLRPSKALPDVDGAAQPFCTDGKSPHMSRISFVGTVTAAESAQQYPKTSLLMKHSEDDQIVRVAVPSHRSDLKTIFAPGQILSVTGYLDKQGSEPLVIPQKLDELVFLGTEQWYTNPRFRWAMLGFFGVLTISLCSVAALKSVIKRRTRELDNSLGLLTASYDAISDGICIINDQGRIRNANPRFWEILDIPEKNSAPLHGTALGRSIASAFAEPDSFMDSWKNLEIDKEETHEGSLLLARGGNSEIRFYSVPAHSRSTHTPLGRVLVLQDLSEQRRLESSLIQAQKMEAVGRLAGGVAHDFNNLLTGIIGNLNIARISPDLLIKDVTEELDAAKLAAERAAELVQNMLTFSRQDSLSIRPACANTVIGQLQTLIRPTLDPSLTLETNLDADLTKAGFDPTKLEQVLLNMVVNSRDALAGKEGTITLGTSNRRIAHPTTKIEGNFVELIISDTGPGMPPETLSQVFEPFFTTKEQGKGTGLGLATSFGIIQTMDGWIDCDSTLGKGTNFRIYLPSVAIESGLATDEESISQAILPVAKRGDRSDIEILCIDDEAVIRQVAEGLLTHSGFRTCAAENGQIGLDLLATRSAAGEELPDLVMTDLTMPTLGGKDTLRAIRKLYPNLPVIICSGYLVDLDEFAKSAGSRPDGFVQKPYSPATLINVIEDILLAPLTA